MHLELLVRVLLNFDPELFAWCFRLPHAPCALDFFGRDERGQSRYKGGMNEFEELHSDTIYLVKNNGVRTGPFRATVGGNKIFTSAASADIEDGDTIVRVVASGREEFYLVIDCGYSPGMGEEIPASYNAKVTKSTAPRPAPRSVINNYNTNFNAPATNTQIGENNRIEINTAVEKIAAIIENSAATPEKKAEAKGIIAKALQSEAVASIIGAMTKGAIDSLTKTD